MTAGRHIVLRGAAIAAAGAMIACGAADEGGETFALPADYVSQVQAWRATHEADYRRDFVTIAGLHFLEPGVASIGSAPGNDIVLEAAVPGAIGRLVVQQDDVRLEPASEVTVLREGRPVPGPAVLKEAARPPAKPLEIGRVTLAVHVTGGRLALRVRDPEGPLARAFAGFSWLAVDPAYRVIGRFIRDASPSKLPVMNTFNGVDMYETEGVVEFELQGRRLRLRPFTTRPGRFYFVFRDASSGVETYEAARFLYADLRDDGRVVLDFNQAYNPPCAFNRYTTCPLPLKENVLPVKVLAGEKAYPKPALE